MSSSSTFFDANNYGNEKFVNEQNKIEASRIAIASASVYVGEELAERIKTKSTPTGDVLSSAQIAGSMVLDLIPLSHNSPLSSVSVKTELNLNKNAVDVESTIMSEDKSGIEIEALLSCSAAVYTVYDMCKALSKDIVIGDVKLMHKFSGQSDFSCIGRGKVLESIALEKYDPNWFVKTSAVSDDT